MKKILLFSALFSLLSHSAFAAYSTDSAANTSTTDDADDIQAVQVTVPEVALLDVEDETIVLTLTAPTDAGTGFPAVGTTDAATDSSTFRLSSNIEAGTSGSRSITVSLSTGSVLPTGSALQITSSGAGTGATATIDADSPSTGNIATAIGNQVVTNGTIDYGFGAATANGMIAHTGTSASSVNITYTLTED